MSDLPLHPPFLTQLAEEEEMFCESVREFGEAKVKPLVHSMDSDGKF